jgi:DNA-binding MurR/RpiR family transcriptional regulator
MNISEAAEPSLSSRVNQQWARLSKTERIVARYLAASAPHEIMLATANDIGARTGTSDATVVRTARRLGYSGLPELKNSLGAHLASGQAPQISSRLHFSQTTHDLSTRMTKVLTDAQQRIEALALAMDPVALGKAIELTASASEVFCYGWGTNELSARYLALRLNRIGKRTRVSGATGFVLADDLLTISANQEIVIFAPGRMLPELHLLIEHAKASGAGVVVVTENLDEEILDRADAVLTDKSSPGALTAEPLCQLLIADLLVLGTMALTEQAAVSTYELLTRLRQEIVGNDE